MVDTEGTLDLDDDDLYVDDIVNVSTEDWPMVKDDRAIDDEDIVDGDGDDDEAVDVEDGVEYDCDDDTESDSLKVLDIRFDDERNSDVVMGIVEEKENVFRETDSDG